MIEYDSHTFSAILGLSMLISLYGLFALSLTVAQTLIVCAEVFVLLYLTVYTAGQLYETAQNLRDSEQ